MAKIKSLLEFNRIVHQIEDKYRVTFKSQSSYYDLFTKEGISWKKTQNKNLRKDPDLVEKKKGNNCFY